MASYGSGVYGYSSYGVIIRPTGSDIGGLIRFSAEEQNPYILVFASDDGVETIRTTLDDTSMELLRSAPTEFGGIIRVETSFDVNADRTALEDQIATVSKTFKAQNTVVVVRKSGESQLTISPDD